MTNLKHYSADGATQITSKSWGNRFSGVAITPLKFSAENISDRELQEVTLAIAQDGGSDGNDYFSQALDTVTLSRPYGVAAVLGSGSSGGLWGVAGTGTKYYVLTAQNPTGETIQSDEVTATVDDGTKKITLQWTVIAAPTGCTGYNIYRSGTPGDYAGSHFLTTASPTASSFDDLGSEDDGDLSAGSPPADNTTGGPSSAYGTPPGSFVATPLAFPSPWPIGQQVFYWYKLTIPIGSSESGNPRTSDRLFAEA